MFQLDCTRLRCFFFLFLTCRMYEDGQVAFKKDLCALFSDLNLLMSNRLCDVTVQVGGFFF